MSALEALEHFQLLIQRGISCGFIGSAETEHFEKDTETIRTALQSAREWMPIESAPRDGTPVDLWLGNAEFPRRETDCVFREFTESEWHTHHTEDEHGKDTDKHWFDSGFRGWPFVGDDFPTHWMKTPPAPKDE